MIEYYPWSKDVLDTSITAYKSNIFSILDVELGGGCNYHCLYCDSPDINKEFKTPINFIREIIDTKQISWLFICGLGEPTFDKNYSDLIQILELCEEKHIKCSLFTNLSLLSTELLDFIKKEVLYIIFKFDTLKPEKIKKIYNTNNPETHLKYLDLLHKYINKNASYTNIAASIVPTKINKSEIPDLISYCMNYGIFPLIGELENSGRASYLFNELKLSKDELVQLKTEVDAIIQNNYSVPICPAVISGIHINHKGQIIVDKYSGLSCSWFWLEEPNVEILLDLTKDKWSYTQIIETIESNRRAKYDFVKNIQKIGEDRIFGGCGGNLKKLINIYVDIFELREE